MENSALNIIPSGLVLKDKEAHAIELIASGSDVHFAEINSGLCSGSINADAAEEVLRAAQNKQPHPEGPTPQVPAKPQAPQATPV